MPVRRLFRGAEPVVSGGSDLLVDAAGMVHRPAPAGARIVSLVPSITELLFDLDLGEAVVGRTAFCVHPVERVRSARSVGGTKQVELAKLDALAPTHVIVNVDETPRALAEALAARGYEIVVTHPIEVSDNLALYRLLGALFGRESEAEALSARFRSAHAALADQARHWPPRRVLYLIWKDPWMTVSAGTYIAQMLALVGWHVVAPAEGGRYPAIEMNEALLAATEGVLFATEPFPFKERHLAAFQEQWPDHADKAMLIDGQMVSWYGSRAIRGLAYLGRLAAAVAGTGASRSEGGEQ